MIKRGKLVVIEGGVGCGKTTQIDLLKKDLKGWEFYREPGTLSTGKKSVTQFRAYTVIL